MICDSSGKKRLTVGKGFRNQARIHELGAKGLHTFDKSRLVKRGKLLKVVEVLGKCAPFDLHVDQGRGETQLCLSFAKLLGCVQRSAWAFKIEHAN